MNAKDFFKIHRKRIRKKIKYQQKIDNLDQESIDDLIKEIKTNHCNDKETLRVTLYMIRKSAFARPKNIFLYLQVIENIIDPIKLFFTGDELAVIFRFLSNKLIFLKLYNLGAIQFDSVLNMIESFHTNITCIEPLIYFYPEVKKYHYQLYLKARPVINKEIINSFPRIEDEITESVESNIIAIINMNLFQVQEDENNPDNDKDINYLCDDPQIEEEFIKLREKGENLDPLAIVIKNDDIDKFQSLLSKKNISVNDCIPFSIFEQCNIINKRKITSRPRFIEYAAFVGSLKIFKFLLNTAELTGKIPKNAVKGGNYEIIHLCEYYKIAFAPKCLTLAIRFHRNEIVDYLLTNFPFHFDVGTTIASIQYYNWKIMAHCIPIYLHPNPNVLNDNFSALATASVNGYLDIVKLLCSLKNIDINSESEGWNSVMYAAFKGYVYLLKYFLSHFKSVDIPEDKRNKDDDGPVFYDVENCSEENGDSKENEEEEEEEEENNECAIDSTQKEEKEQNIISDENESNNDENENNKNENESNNDENENNQNENESNNDENESNNDEDENNKNENESNNDEDENNQNENESNNDEDENNKNENESNNDENENNKNENESNNDENENNKNENENDNNNEDENNNNNEDENNKNENENNNNEDENNNNEDENNNNEDENNNNENDDNNDNDDENDENADNESENIDDDQDVEINIDINEDSVDLDGREDNSSSNDDMEISNIIDLNQTWERRTPLEIAVINKKLNVVKYLLGFKTVFDYSKQRSSLLIEIAEKKGYTAIVEYLREAFEVD